MLLMLAHAALCNVQPPSHTGTEMEPRWRGLVPLETSSRVMNLDVCQVLVCLHFQVESDCQSMLKVAADRNHC